MSSNIDAADAASGDAGNGNSHTGHTIAGNAHNASNGNTEAIASCTAVLMNPDRDRTVVDEHLNIRPVLGDDGETTSTTQTSRVGKVLSWVPDRDIADLRAPGSGDGGGPKS